MTLEFNLVMKGNLIKGGTTAEAQIAYLRDNDKAIRTAIVQAGCYRERTSDIVDLLKLEITEITVWRRDADKALREIVRRAQAEQKQAAHNRSQCTLKGRPPKASGITQASRPTAPATMPPLPSTFPPTPAPTAPKPIVPTSHSPSPTATTMPLPTTGPRPRVTTLVRDLTLSPALKGLLMAFVKDAGEEELRALYANIEPNWRSLSLPADIRSAMGWIDALN